MALRNVAPLVVALVLIACAGEPPRDPKPAVGTATAAAPIVAKASAPEPAWFLDDGCDLDSTVAYPEPLALVREFVERDGRGEFARGGGSWLGGAVLCPGHLPGPDTFSPIDTMHVLESDLVVRGDTAWVPVRYALLGEADMHRFWAVARADVVDTFVVARTPWGWRVAAPDMPMRIRVSAATEWEDMDDSLRTVLRAAAAAARARSTP